jgi:hypothetical protein
MSACFFTTGVESFPGESFPVWESHVPAGATHAREVGHPTGRG